MGDSRPPWLSLYAWRLAKDLRPTIEVRTMTRDVPPGVNFSDGILSPRTHTIGFMARLFWAWVLMGFRSGRVEAGGPLCLPEARLADFSEAVKIGTRCLASHALLVPRSGPG